MFEAKSLEMYVKSTENSNLTSRVPESKVKSLNGTHNQEKPIFYGLY